MVLLVNVDSADIRPVASACALEVDDDDSGRAGFGCELLHDRFVLAPCCGVYVEVGENLASIDEHVLQALASGVVVLAEV